MAFYICPAEGLVVLAGPYSLWKLTGAVGFVLVCTVIFSCMKPVSGSVELSYPLRQLYIVETSPIPFDQSYITHMYQQFAKKCFVHRKKKKKQVFRTDLCLMAFIVVVGSIINMY